MLRKTELILILSFPSLCKCLINKIDKLTYFTRRTCISWKTGAVVRIDAICTCSTILTWLRATVIDVWHENKDNQFYILTVESWYKSLFNRRYCENIWPDSARKIFVLSLDLIVVILFSGHSFNLIEMLRSYRSNPKKTDIELTNFTIFFFLAFRPVWYFLEFRKDHKVQSCHCTILALKGRTW